MKGEGSKGLSMTKRGSKKMSRSSSEEKTTVPSKNLDDLMEITLDVTEDSVAVHSVHAAETQRQVAFTGQKFDPTNSAAVTLMGLKFIALKSSEDESSWTSVEAKFDELTAESHGLLDSSGFGECIGMKDSQEFARKLFRALARRHNIREDTVNKVQLWDFWAQISDENFDSRLQTFFDMVDQDADGRISKEDVREIISISASANKLSSINNKAEEYAALIMEELDPDNVGYITAEHLEYLLAKAPEKPVKLTESRKMSQLLSQLLKPTNPSQVLTIVREKTEYFVMDNWQRLWIMALWLSIVFGLFVYKFVQYKNKAAFGVMGYCVCIAKGSAETLKFNMALILLPVCRNTITWLRNKTKIGVAVPFDDNLNFHKVVAAAIAVGVGLHAGAHLTCDFPRLIHATEAEYEPMKPYFGDDQPENYWWFLKGVEGITGIIMVVLMAIAFTLATPVLRGKPKVVKKGAKILKKKPQDSKKKNPSLLGKLFKRLTGFNAFWYTHHLFIVVYALLVVHGLYLFFTKTWYQKTTWMYLSVPVCIYACERLKRAFKSIIKPVKILKARVYPGQRGVLALQMIKPEGFKYKCGQYMFVNCRAVSPFEWHPFSITSAPGDEYLSVHIRAVGDWTRQLNKEISKVCRPLRSENNGVIGADVESGEVIFPKIMIDGPYGAPAQEYKQYEVVLLIGLGIGATPMVSILKDIIAGVKQPDGPTRPSPRKAYYYWMTPEQDTFEWFKEILDEVAAIDEEGIIELHNHCTSVFEEGDVRSTFITMLQSIQHAKNGVDVVGGTNVMCHFARPKWRQVYKRIAVRHPNTRVGVFYCGHPGLVDELRKWAMEFSHKTTTKFEFHKENF